MGETTAKAVGHTPGPWVVHDTDRVWVQTTDADANVICDIIGRVWDKSVGGSVIKAEDFANARLIAASPDLLASCKELRDALAGAIRVVLNCGIEDVANRFNAEMRRIGIKPGIGVRADATISKAEGRTK
jgi:hypothetical protein